MQPSSTKVYLVHSKDLNSSNSYYKQRPDLTTSSRKPPKMTGCLEIIDGEDSEQSKTSWESPNYSRPSSATGARPWSRGSIGCCPPRTDSSMSRRMNTPTKQISLQAVRRKEESTEPFVDQVDWQSLALETKRTVSDPETNPGYSELTKQLSQVDGLRLEAVVETSWQATEKLLSEPVKMAGETTSQAEAFCEDSIVETAPGSGISSGEKTIDERNSDDSDDDDDDDDDSGSSEEEEEKLRAPNELLMEFVDCLMRKDYQTASKLCKMILLYEPENSEALKFQPLIEEKLVLDAEAEKVAAEESSGNDDSDNESENEDDDSSDDSEDDDGDSCSDADSSDEENDGNDDDDSDDGNNESGLNINNNSSRIEQSCYHRYLN